MSPHAKKAIQIVVDNLFWLFVALMIVLGTVLPQPFIASGTGS